MPFWSRQNEILLQILQDVFRDKWVCTDHELEFVWAFT